MLCSKCGNPLPDDAQFCGACGAPVEILQKASGKKSKKGLVIGLSIGAVLIAALAVVLIFALGKKSDDIDDSLGSVPLGYSSVVYDDRYTYFLSETETWEPCIKRVRNDLSGEPEILYESEEIKGDGWSLYPIDCIFLWNDKICFIEITKATEQGDREYEIHWLSKDGEENGTLVSYEQLYTYGDLLSQMGGIYFFDDYLIFGNSYFFYRLDLNTGELCKSEDFLDFEGSACFAAYNDGYYYYFVPDVENNLMGETLYRKSEKSEEEIVGKVPSQDDDDVEKYFSFISKGNYLYYADLNNIYRLNIEDGNTENLASYEETYNRFALCESGLYYFKDMALHFLNTETLVETIFDNVDGTPNLIYAGAGDACWMQDDSTSHRYNCFLPDEQGGLFVYFGESNQDASTEVQIAVPENVSTQTDQSEFDITSMLGEWTLELSLQISQSDAEYVPHYLIQLNADGTMKLRTADESWLDYTYTMDATQFYFNDSATGLTCGGTYTVSGNTLIVSPEDQAEMEDVLNELGIAVPENSSGNTFSVYDYEGNWTWQQEDGDMTASLQLKATDESTLSGQLSFYRFFSDQLTITMSPDYTGTVTSDFGGFQGTARFEAGNLYFSFEDRIFYYDREISEAFGTTEFCFTSENPPTQTGNSEFDMTSMLGEWTLEEHLPNDDYVPRYLIRLNADGTMDLRGEDGTWDDYTYTIDATHFYYTYPPTGLTGGGTYTVSGDTLRVVLED